MASLVSLLNGEDESDDWPKGEDDEVALFDPRAPNGLSKLPNEDAVDSAVFPKPVLPNPDSSLETVAKDF